MITQADMNKVLADVNKVLANLNERIQKLEEAQASTKRTTSNSSAKS